MRVSIPWRLALSKAASGAPSAPDTGTQTTTGTALAEIRAVEGPPLLSVRDLRVHFPVAAHSLKHEHLVLRAVDGVDLDVPSGSTLGLLGESGCGKSTLGRAVAQLLRPTAGQVAFGDLDLTAMWQDGWLGSRFVPEPPSLRQHIQMIFQDPYASLNPRMTVLELVSEPLRAFGLASRAERAQRVGSLLARVGLDPQHLRRYPHEFSGGQCQRIGIARALAAKPKLIVCDEPTSALDVSVRAQVLNLLRGLQKDQGFSYLYISHDLSSVYHMASTIAVMYLGKIVEVASASDLSLRPRHPYSKALVAAVPIPDPKKERARVRLPLVGEVPSPIHPPTGCAFHTRCPEVQDRCRGEAPPLRDLGNGARVACHFV